MKNTFVVCTKKGGHHGRNVLISFAAKPLWKDYEEIRRQEDRIPDCYDKKTATYAKNKYAKGDMFEIVNSEIVNAELTEYKKTPWH